MKTVLFTTAVILLGLGCSPRNSPPAPARPAAEPAKPDALAIALARHEGESLTDVEIRRRQDEIRSGIQVDIALERLGWLYVSKARESFDAGFFKLAENCANALEARTPHCAEAMLLRGHVLQNLHRFAESEAVARELVATRGLAFDFGVLGDALMEQGKLNEAIQAYQQMADLKPDSQAAARAAHVRWLKGDVSGAIEMMEQAAVASDPRDSENAAWVFTRLAALKFQSTGDRTNTSPDFTEVERDCETALTLRADYPPALLLRGKILMAQKKFGEAVEALRAAEKQNPLPEYQWALADALVEAGRGAEAREVEAKLRRFGASADPRSFSLFLATRAVVSDPERERLPLAAATKRQVAEKIQGRFAVEPGVTTGRSSSAAEAALALRLAREELTARADVFTHDALAWAHLANGNVVEARQCMERALAEGTQDARLFLHAAVIAAYAGKPAEAENFLKKSDALGHLLLPSERKQVCTVAAELTGSRAVAASPAGREPFSADGRTF